jgi:DNA gyrase subunit A
MMEVTPVPLHVAARERYLAYALSVVTSRALPDVRDGLKPVQRRILFTMFHELSLHPSGRYRKCAAVVGDVMGKYHPHGDQAIYDALVRMAQDFTLRATLVDGQGNFGSLDGDKAAAMRYTECRLTALAEELLTELKKRTVDYRPNYDGQRFEPIVLPAQFPHLLINGCEGIAVGMATRIPPHNLGEIIDATVALIDDPSLNTQQLMEYVKGPDFPTAGQILSDTADIASIYETGQGTLRVRAQYELEREGRRKLIVIHSVPYGVNKGRLLERIGQHVQEKKLPQVVDVRDESTEDVRVVIELKVGSSVEAVMAYLYKHTPLEGTWSVNMTALIPSENPDVARPARLNLHECLSIWLKFRNQTIRRRFEYDLQQLLDRIHILEGFSLIFDALDEVIALIRKSEGKRDAAERLMDRFDLTEIQTDAILELKLYRLARLEILLIQEELDEKRLEAARIQDILSSVLKIWSVVRAELLEIRALYATPRKTVIAAPEKQLVYDADAYIVKEDSYVVVTRDGWIKRQSSFTNMSKIRIREGDEIGWLIRAHTRSTVSFFTSHGVAYVMRVDDVPATTGYGEPVQRHFKFSDGERIVGVLSNDSRHRPPLAPPEPVEEETEQPPPPPYCIAFTEHGRVLQFSLKSHEEISNRNGRRFGRLKTGDAIFVVYELRDEDKVCVATRFGRAMIFPTGEIPILKAAGKGVTGIKLRPEDYILACELATSSLDGPKIFTAQGRELVVRERKFGISKRGSRGKVVLKRGHIENWERRPQIELGPVKQDDGGEEE